MNQQNRNKLIDPENELMAARGEGGWEAGWQRWRDWEAQAGGYNIVTGL